MAIKVSVAPPSVSISAGSNQFVPVLSFYFRVEVDNDVVSFQDVSGLESSLEIEEIPEGGNNENKIRTPKRFIYTNLVLSRGLLKEEDTFYKWVKNALMNKDTLGNSFEDNVKNIRIELLSTSDGVSIRSWNIEKAYPVKWSMSNFNSSESKIAMETVELTFQNLYAD